MLNSESKWCHTIMFVIGKPKECKLYLSYSLSHSVPVSLCISHSLYATHLIPVSLYLSHSLSVWLSICLTLYHPFIPVSISTRHAIIPVSLSICFMVYFLLSEIYSSLPYFFICLTLYLSHSPSLSLSLIEWSTHLSHFLPVSCCLFHCLFLSSAHLCLRSSPCHILSSTHPSLIVCFSLSIPLLTLFIPLTLSHSLSLSVPSYPTPLSLSLPWEVSALSPLTFL